MAVNLAAQFDHITRPALNYQQGMTDKLADIITELLNDHEPLLKATRDGTEITVTERGGPLVFTVTVEPKE